MSGATCLIGALLWRVVVCLGPLFRGRDDCPEGEYVRTAYKPVVVSASVGPYCPVVVIITRHINLDFPDVYCTAPAPPPLPDEQS